MPIESAVYISDLVITNPVGTTDTVATLDNHIRLLKTVLQVSFTGITGAVTSTHTRLNYLTSAGGTTGTTSTNLVFSTSPTLVTPLLGTPTSGTLTNCTGLPVSSGISGLGSGVATFLATPSSANLISAVTDETGSGALVFATSPTLVTPTLGVASATSYNGLFVTTTTGTLTIASAKTMTVSNTLTFTGTDTSSVAFGTGGTVLYSGGALGSPSSAGTLPAFTLGGTVTLNGQSFSGTCANGGTFTTIDINGGTVDGAVIGGASAAAGSFTTVTASSVISSSGSIYGGGALLLAGGAGSQNGIYTTATGTPEMIFDHRGTSNTGLYKFRNGTDGTTTLMQLDSTNWALDSTVTAKFGTHTGSADVAISGYITIKDAAGNPRKLAVIT